MAPQSSKYSDPFKTVGAQNEPTEIPVKLQCVKAHFPEAEREYFAATGLGGKMGQTHNTHPDPEMCYRCPLCDKVLNPNGIARHTNRHFLAQRKIPNRIYEVPLNEAADKKIRNKTGSVSAGRSGAGPPQSLPQRRQRGQGGGQVVNTSVKNFIMRQKKARRRQRQKLPKRRRKQPI